MPRIIELRERQAELATQARARFDEITNDTPEERAKEIEAEFDRMMAEHDRIGAQADRLERLEGAERAAEERATAEAETRARARRPQRGDGAAGDDEGDDGPPEYLDVFERALRFGVAELSGEERGILRQGQTAVPVANLPPELRAQSVGTDAAGGYTVPQTWMPELDRQMAAWGPMWDAEIVRELNTSTGAKINWPTTDDTGKSGRIKAENAAVDDDGTDDVVFGEKELDAFIYDTGMVKVPLELLMDSQFNMETLLSDLFGERLGRAANTALTTGTGSAQPNGIVTAAAAGKTTASGTAITADEIIDLQHSVDPAYRASPRCRWQFNDSVLSYIRKLKDGQNNYLWQMGDVRVGEPATLLGHPYSVNQAMASVAVNNRTMVFGDHSRYIVRKVIGFTMLTLRERYAENFQVGMVGFKRFDGELLNTAAVKAMVQAAT